MDSVIKCVAIDDEPLALDVIAAFCRRMGGVELLVFSDPVLGLEAIRREKPQIAFLDIEMGNLSGITIARELPPDTCFIFTTAYLSYAMEGFELDAVDYLHKPFSYSRFQTAFSKALRRIGAEAQPAGRERSILVKQDYNNVRILLADILYIEAMVGYVKIFMEDGTCNISRVILKNIGAQLPDSEFIRIHRSFIVAKSKVRSFSKREVVLKNGRTLPVGRLYASNVAEALAGS